MASHIEHDAANQVKKGGYCLIKDHPCKVIETNWSKPGKHGAGKIQMIGIDIFTGKKVETSSPSTHNVEIPVVKRRDVQLLDIGEEGYLSVLDGEDSHEKLKLPEHPEGLADKIREAFEEGSDVDLVVTSAMGNEQVSDLRVHKN
jgi:translation initiation factor 5A